jgi:hypothetical protein
MGVGLLCGVLYGRSADPSQEHSETHLSLRSLAARRGDPARTFCLAAWRRCVYDLALKRSSKALIPSCFKSVSAFVRYLAPLS